MVLRRGWTPAVFRRHERIATDFLAFAQTCGVDRISPQHRAPAWLVAEYLYDVIVSRRVDLEPLQRPESTVKQVSAAISLLEGRPHDSVINTVLMRQFKRGLIKMNTTRPIQHRPEADLAPMLRFWCTRVDQELSEQDLRCKAVGLLAIVKMSRPSDIARVRLRHQDFHFNGRGQLVEASPIYLFSKTDQLRHGSVDIPIPATSSDGQCDFVHTAYEYFTRTCRDRRRLAPQHPFVLSLPRPGQRRRAVGKDTVARILRRFASEAGVVADAAGFRPAAVTRALDLGYPLHVVARVTGHKSLEVLQQHYNRARVPASMVAGLQDPDAGRQASLNDSSSSQ